MRRRSSALSGFLQKRRTDADRLAQLDRLRKAGDAARDRRDWPTAAKLYQELIANDAQDLDIAVQLGHAYKEMGDFRRAAHQYYGVLSDRLQDDDLHLQIGHLEKLRGNIAEAFDHYRIALELNPNNLDAKQEYETLAGLPISTADYVRWAYRLLLGREPQYPEAMREFWQMPREAILWSFLRSPEFLAVSRAQLGLRAGENQWLETADGQSTGDDLSDCFRLLLGWNPQAAPRAASLFAALTGDPPIPAEAPVAIKQGSRICRQADLCTDAFRYWMSRMRARPAMTRKLWEWFFISDALFQRDKLKAECVGVGFGVGTEPLTALFASLGCSILATDLATDHAASGGWVKTGQHARELDALKWPEICEDHLFNARVRFRAVDMNDIPQDLDAQFDFCWSSCALEHLGSLDHGLRFVERTMALLKPGGVAVHTTEYNMSSNSDTLETPELSLYRRQDIDGLTARLAEAGHRVEAIDWDQGCGYADGYVDLPPYGRTPLHLRLALAGYTFTSLGLIIHKRSSPLS